MTAESGKPGTKDPDDWSFDDFEGFDGPNYTPAPDLFFDVIAPRLSEAELKVLLYIIRRTFGFRKNADTISLGQMVDGIVTRDGRRLNAGAGVARSSAVRAIKGLVEKGLITAQHNSSPERGNEPTTYALRFRRPAPSSTVEPGGSESETPPGFTVEPGGSRRATSPSSITELALVSPQNPHETIKQHAIRQGVDLSKAPPTEIIAESEYNGAGSPPANLAGQLLDNRDDSGEGKGPQIRRRGRRDQPGEAPRYLQAVIVDYSRELHDEAHAAANITRAARLQRASGLAERAFVELVHAARTMTRARGNIRKAADGDPALRNRMPYFFAVLEDLLARAGEEDDPAEGQEAGTSAGRGWTPEGAERYTSGPYGRLVQG